MSMVFPSSMKILLSYVPGMHVVVFTRSSVARALAPIPICCSIFHYTKRTKPSADKCATDPWVRVVPSFPCKSLFHCVCVRAGDDVFLVETWNLLEIFLTRYRMPLLGAFCCRCTRSVSPEPSAARMPFMIFSCHPQDIAVGRDITHYSFSSIRTVVHGFSKALIIKYKTSAVRSRISWKLIFASCVGYFDLVWSKTRIRCGILYYL